MVRRAKPVGAGHRWERGGKRSDYTRCEERELKGTLSHHVGGGGQFLRCGDVFQVKKPSQKPIIYTRLSY